MEFLLQQQSITMRFKRAFNAYWHMEVISDFSFSMEIMQEVFWMSERFSVHVHTQIEACVGVSVA